MSITTGTARASYVNIFQPKAPMNGVGDPKYSMSLLIPKSDKATLDAIYAEIERVKQDAVQKTFGGQLPANLRLPILDGDGLQPGGEPFGEECRGCMVLRVSSKDRPDVVDRNIQPILNPASVYSGCYVRASVNFFAYNQAGNRGIGCGFHAVQKVEDGEPLTSRVTASEAFGGSNAYVASSASQAPAAGYQPGYSPAPAYQAPAAPQYQQQAPVVPQYQQQAPAVYQQQPAPYTAPAAPQQGAPWPQIDPITGMPVMPGGVMGI